MVVKHLTDGGIPNGWSVENLRWLAQAHRRHAAHKFQAFNCTRAAWHQRWAALIEDLLESRYVYDH